MRSRATPRMCSRRTTSRSDRSDGAGECVLLLTGPAAQWRACGLRRARTRCASTSRHVTSRHADAVRRMKVARAIVLGKLELLGHEWPDGDGEGQAQHRADAESVVPRRCRGRQLRRSGADRRRWRLAVGPGCGTSGQHPDSDRVLRGRLAEADGGSRLDGRAGVSGRRRYRDLELWVRWRAGWRACTSRSASCRSGRRRARRRCRRPATWCSLPAGARSRRTSARRRDAPGASRRRAWPPGPGTARRCGCTAALGSRWIRYGRGRTTTRPPSTTSTVSSQPWSRDMPMSGSQSTSSTETRFGRPFQTTVVS